MTNDDPYGLETSPAFRRYIDRLRRLWPANPELAEEHGALAGNEHSHEITMKSESGATGAQNTNMMERRAFMLAVGATGAALATGSVAAQEAVDNLNFGADVVPNPAIASTVTIAEHAASFDALEYYDDEGEAAMLPAVIDDRHPDDADETTSNLYTVRADRVDAADYRRFPPLERENSDDETESITAIDPDEWTAGSELTLAEGDTEIDSLRISSDGVADGSESVATFDVADLGVDADQLVETDPRQHFQVVANVNQLNSAGTVEIRALDADGDYYVLKIDPNGDRDADADVIATANGAGFVKQTQLGDLTAVQGASGDGEVDEIASIEIAVIDADADVTIAGLNLERMSRWEYGSTVQNELDDDNRETVTVRDPAGAMQLTDFSSGLLDGSTIYGLEVPVLYDAASSESDPVHELEETDRHPPYDAVSRTYARIETVTAYDIEHSDVSMIYDQGMPSERYSVLEYSEDTADIDDDDLVENWSGTDVLAELQGEGELATLEEFPTTGVEYTVRSELRLTESETDGLYRSGGGGGGGARGTSGGWFSGARGAVMSLVIGLVGFLGLNRLLPGGD